jgi:carbon monoxide dehydrogenase subunit G
MTRIVSDIKQIDSEIAPVYSFVSDFNRLGELIKMARQRVQEGGVPEGKEGEQVSQLAAKIEDIRTTEDTCTFVVSGFGEVGMKIEERQEPTMVKFAGDGRLPFAFNVWIQLLEHGPHDTRLRVTCEAELNMMLNMMLKGKLEKGINQLAEGLARLPYALMR